MSESKAPTQSDAARRALKMKSEAPDAHHPSGGQTAGEGMTPLPNSDLAPSGALDAEGQRPVLERSRKAR